MINPLLLSLRQELHQHPEASGCETVTRQIIRRFLEENTPLPFRKKAGRSSLSTKANALVKSL